MRDFASFVQLLLSLSNTIVALLIAVALVIFFWGIVRYIYSAGASEAKVNGRELMLWGIIALVVLICVWGIVAVVRNTFFH